MRDVVASDGWRGLYRGCGPTLCRTFVGQATALTVYDWALALTRASDDEPVPRGAGGR